MKRYLFVCTGNTCRSAMAAAIAQNLCLQGGIEASVKSAGTTADADLGINPKAAMALEGMGISHQHSTHRLTAKDIDDADVVFAMEQKHLAQIELLLGGRTAHGKATLLDDPRNIADPLGNDLACYRQTAHRLYDVIRSRLRHTEADA